MSEEHVELNLFELMEEGDFNSIEWVNRLVDSCENKDDDELLLNTVRSAQTRLQTRSQELSRDAERLMERLLAVGPRALQELDRVERDAQTLKQDLKRVQEESKSSTSSPAAPFQVLKSLDTIKTNLERCVNVLEETGSWNSLVKEMEQFFANRNLGEVASRLSTMRITCANLVAFPGNHERQEMMERMEQRLESLVRPGLATALDEFSVSGEKEALKQSVIVYTKLGRMDALLLEFGQARGKHLFQSSWTPQSSRTSSVLLFSDFLEHIWARLRSVEIPLVEYCFHVEQHDEALVFVIRSCFDCLTVENVHSRTSGCESYVVARLAVTQFSVDIQQTLLRRRLKDSDSDLVRKSISRVFDQLDQEYLEREAQELIAQLKTNQELNPSDVFDRLIEECISRCTRIKMNFLPPLARLFQFHLNSPIWNDKQLDAKEKLVQMVSLSQRFNGLLSLHSPDDSFALVKQEFAEKIERAKSQLFVYFMNPAWQLLDQCVSQVDAEDAITRTVDHLYSLIPLLEFDSPVSRDFLANRFGDHSERAELHRLVGGEIAYRSPTLLSDQELTAEEEEDLPRLISASWLETIARALCTGFVLRVLRLPTLSNDVLASRLGRDADILEKNAASVLGHLDKWDPALGVCRVMLSTLVMNLTLGNPMGYLDQRYCLEETNRQALLSLEHIVLGLRTARGEAAVVI